MAKSLAFWLDGSKSPETAIELHFNFWLLNMGSKKEVNYLDVGVKFKNLDDIDSINIYFPFKVTKQNYINSLGNTLSNDNGLIEAIFNARIDSVTKITANVIDISFIKNKADKLRLFSQIEIDENGNNGVKIQPQDDGTILVFPKNLITNSPNNSINGKNTEDGNIFGYFRFRIKLSTEDKISISQLDVSKDAKLLSRMESIEIVDFRVNEVRNLPQKIVSRLSNDSCITDVHFFLIRDTHAEHKLSHSEFKRCRLLEKNIWDNYLNVDSGVSIPEQMLIYHWKEPLKKQPDTQEYLDNFSAFAKFSSTSVTWETITCFIAIIVFLGAISGVIGNYVYSILPTYSNLPAKNDLPCDPMKDNETKPTAIQLRTQQ